MTSYVELAVLFHSRRFGLTSQPGVDTTFHAIAALLRRAFTAVAGLGTASFFPGAQKANRAKSCGRCLPTGVIGGAVPFCTPNELARFAAVLFAGAGKRCPSWLIPVNDFPC